MPAAVELAHQVAAGDVDQCALDWLAESFRRHLAGEPLDVALRLDRVSRLRARDQALRRAAELLGDCGSAWDRAKRLAQAIRRFEARIAPRLRPGDELPPIDAALRVAFAAAPGRVPTNPRQLYRVLV